MQSKQQRRYGAILREYRNVLAPHLNGKDLWNWAKTITPYWPRGKNRAPVSTKEVDEEVLKRHCDYIVRIARCREDGGCEGRIDGLQIEDGIWEVRCSRCGIWTKRRLSPQREQELVAIIEGEYEEQMNPVSVSFICDHCFQEIIKEDK